MKKMIKHSNKYPKLTKEAEKLLEPYLTVMEMTIPWGDMNAGNHVSNTAYFRYFENARVHFLEQLDFAQIDEVQGGGIVLASISCKFRIPLIYPDTISIGTQILSIEHDRFTMDHIIVSHKHQKIAAEGEALVVTYDYAKNCKSPVPQALISKINSLIRERLLN
ncbi:MAG: acyl-CoA thioesterase [Desulfamplus sp.]|nr:acyl-CoA thioesterase [Desulfamplus sp.]MBF0241280.1 acyl-CoA thioesterase [Desulfamplus sp.]